MTVDDIIQKVITIVKRPDLQPRIEDAIQAAILKTHQSDFFYRDIVEYPIIFQVTQYLQQFTPSDIIPNFRKAKYIRRWHGDATGRAGAFLQPIQIENSVDDYSYHKTDVFYMAGKKLQIRTATPLSTILFGAYVYPIITPLANTDSWIVREFPYVIIYDAAFSIFSSIGFAEQARNYASLYQLELQRLLNSNVDDVPLT